jgi:hypothetical protein
MISLFLMFFVFDVLQESLFKIKIIKKVYLKKLSVKIPQVAVLHRAGPKKPTVKERVIFRRQSLTSISSSNEITHTPINHMSLYR